MVQEKRTTQIIQSAFTMLSQMMGSSILAFPFVVNKIGWVLTAIILFHSVASMLFCMHYYIEAAYYTRALSYKDLTSKLLGKKIAVLLDVSLILSNYGFMVAYVIVSSRGVITFVLNRFHYTMNSYAVKVVIAFCIMFPLTLLKSLKQLAKISTVAGMIIFVFVFTVVAYFFIGLKKQVLCTIEDANGPHDITYGLPAFPRTSGIMGFLYFVMYLPSIHGNFSCHPVIPRFLKELVAAYPQRKRMLVIALRLAIGAVCICLCLTGFMGAAMFGADIQQNILNGLGLCKFVWIDILSLLYALVVIINFPLVLYPLKTSIVQTLGHQIETPKGYKISILVDLAFVICALLLALFLETIVSIFGLFASIAGFFYYFVMPFYFFIVHKKLQGENSHVDNEQDPETQQAAIQQAREQVIQHAAEITESQSANVQLVLEARIPQVASEDVQNSTRPIAQPVQVAKNRKIVGYLLMFIYFCICLEGVVMNMGDVIKSFK
ncbi:Amino_acid transporter family protein [Hexamita inflata]|uniref:Amino acid transporter family protein n=1 Tax=Hexamita inflata TaxID=28002 RepID=A0AA86QEZ9_9EUKA|nr:Amino acid transporter family protein [Hexamita inflata]